MSSASLPTCRARATVIARTDLVVARIEQHSLIRLSAEYPSIAIAIIHELGGRLARMNRSLAYLTYAAEALRRDEYDSALLEKLTSLPGELANFARAFAGMASRNPRQAASPRRRCARRPQIQQSILPPPLDPAPLEAPPARRPVDLHAEMHPAREIGGDFYDYFLIDANRLAITVADVSGKGIPASLFMAVSRTVMRSISGGKRHGLRHVGGQSPAGDAKYRLHVRDDVSRRARSGERRRCATAMPATTRPICCGQGRPAIRSAPPGSRSASRTDMPTASPKPC